MYVRFIFTCIICATIICLTAATHDFNLFTSIIDSKRVSIMSTEIHSIFLANLWETSRQHVGLTYDGHNVYLTRSHMTFV